MKTAGNALLIDLFTLALTHGLMALAAIRLLSRDELDSEGDDAKSGKWQRPKQQNSPAGEG